MRRSRAWLAVVVSGVLGAAALTGAPVLAQDDAPSQPASSDSGLVFGPKLLYYPVECQDPRDCRIDCFQNGVNIASRGSIGLQDEVRLVVNAGISDEIIPRWIEIKPFDGDQVQTILLTPRTACDFKEMVIAPRNQP